MTRLAWPLPLIASALAAGCAATSSQTTPPLQPQLERHIAAVLNRDLAETEATITGGPSLLLILPSGRVSRTRDEYVAFHRTVYANDQWTAAFQPLETRSFGDYAQALYRVTFDLDGPGPSPPGAAYLTLGFALEAGSWRLVHDQNTAISPMP